MQDATRNGRQFGSVAASVFRMAWAQAGTPYPGKGPGNEDANRRALAWSHHARHLSHA
jgi:hypothetical protein